MALGQGHERRTYLSINNGKVVQGTGAEKQYYTYIEGCIEAIYTRHSHFGGEDVVRWYIDIRDGEEFYSLCLPYSSGVFKSIILSLASCESLSTSTPVKIEPYEGRNGYTKVVVYANGIKLDWATKDIPPQDIVKIGGREVKDDTKQMEYISSFCLTIMERLRKNT